MYEHELFMNDNGSITYGPPEPSRNRMTVELNKYAPRFLNFANRYGITARYTEKKGVSVGWSEVVFLLRYLLDRSPEARNHVRAMLDEIEPQGQDTMRAMLTKALANGWRIDKHADPTEGACEGLTLDEALAVAAEDPTLLTLRMP